MSERPKKRVKAEELQQAAECPPAAPRPPLISLLGQRDNCEDDGPPESRRGRKNQRGRGDGRGAENRGRSGRGRGTTERSGKKTASSKVIVPTCPACGRKADDPQIDWPEVPNEDGVLQKVGIGCTRCLVTYNQQLSSAEGFRGDFLDYSSRRQNDEAFKQETDVLMQDAKSPVFPLKEIEQIRVKECGSKVSLKYKMPKAKQIDEKLQEEALVHAMSRT